MNHKEWKIPYSRPECPQALCEAGYRPLLASVLALRGIRTPEAARQMLEGGPGCLHDPMKMLGMSVAVERVRQAIRLGETVAVYGDYDVDGITATCLVTDYLRSKGLRCIPYIPDRSGEGYGLNCAALESLREDGVRLVITVDCGITALEEADFARQLGIDMVITDHHECKSGALPDAIAVIDCKQPGDGYPNPDLAGVGVALKLVCACEGESETMLARYADLVALGTVADVMPLTDENRYLVRRGLEKLEQDPLPGFAAMLREVSVAGKPLTASLLGFSLAPRLNAAGRLGQATRAAELLMSTDAQEAAQLAAELCELNRQRQHIETEIWQEAQALLAGTVPDGPIVLASDHWHQGVIGIAASRLAEQYALPAVMICLSGEQGKGSCRSYGGFNLFEALSACSEHLLGFGGHALAAGLTIRRDQVDAFRAALKEYYRAHRPAPQPELCCEVRIDDPALLDFDSVRQLDLLEPYGNGNPKPLLYMNAVELEACDQVGNGRHLRLRVCLRGSHFEGIFFSHNAKQLGLNVGDKIDLAFTPQINEYRGHASVQLLIAGARPHDGSAHCDRLLHHDHDAIGCAAAFCPERCDFVRLWRGAGGAFALPESPEDILALCPPDMEPERYCLCLLTLQETGLLRSGDGSIFGAKSAVINGKADLEATSIIRTLRSL